jgi:Alpha galactosidase C-terminal beta sandwich domain/Alpha galactosidase A
LLTRVTDKPDPTSRRARVLRRSADLVGLGQRRVNVSPLSLAHAGGVSARGLGSGVTLSAPLTLAHATTATVRDESQPGTGITFSPALTAAHPVGAVVRGGGTGITLTTPVTMAHPAGTSIGKTGLSLTESRTHFTLWALDSAPLLAGTNVADMAAQNLAIYLNKDVIALDRDPLGVQVFTVSNANSQWTLRKPLADGDTAVAVFNAATTPWTNATVGFGSVGLDPGTTYLAKDLWSKQVTAVTDPISVASVAGHATVVYRVSSRPHTHALCFLMARSGAGVSTRMANSATERRPIRRPRFRSPASTPHDSAARIGPRVVRPSTADTAPKVE